MIILTNVLLFGKKKTPFKQNKIKSNEEIHEKNPIVGGA